MDKLQSKVILTEKLTYEFRRDLAKNMNEIETSFSKRLDQMARALAEIASFKSMQYKEPDERRMTSHASSNKLL